MEKYVYMYMLNSFRYLSELIVSYESLKETNPKYPVYCLVSDDISRDNRTMTFLYSIGINTIIATCPISEYIYDGTTDSKEKWYCSGRLEMFNLTQFDKICSIDTDTYIIKNMDDVFDYPTNSMADHLYYDGLNGGVILLKPDTKIFNFYLQLREEGYANKKFKYRYDQNFVEHLNEIFSDVEIHKLPYIYNTIVFSLNRVNVDLTDVRLLHIGTASFKTEDATIDTINYYCDRWLGGNKEIIVEYILLYLKYYNKIIKKYRSMYPHILLALPVIDC